MVKSGGISIWPILVALGLLTSVGINMLLLTFAAGGYTGTLDSDPYEKGLNYQDEINAEKAFRDAGWTIDVSPRPFALSILDRDQNPVSGAKVSAVALNVSSKEGDIRAELEERGAGRYEKTESALASGRWLIQLRIERGNEKFLVKEQRSVE